MTALHDKRPSWIRKNGFSLTEVIFAVFLFALVSAGVYIVFIQTLFDVKKGTSQANFLAMARSAEGQITKIVQGGQSISVFPTYVDVTVDSRLISRISFVDGDGIMGTADDNELRYIPNMNQPQDYQVLCKNVMSLWDGTLQTPMFELLPSSPAAVQFRFHVGDGMTEEDYGLYKTGQGWQGVEMRFSASPRRQTLIWL